MHKYYVILIAVVLSCLPALATQPVVAIHVSELTQAMETIPATPPTPTDTGFQWWNPDWHYLVMPETIKEALRSDGTPYVVVTDSDISAGKLLAPDGSPNYPIVISLASESVRDDEITPLINYVSAGGYLLVGSSAFTRNPDGTTRGDFALASSLGMHMANANLQDWIRTSTITVVSPHRLVSHLPSGTLNWQMPRFAEDDGYNYQDTWQTVAGDATVIVATDNGVPMISVKNYGKGTFIYYAAMQPMMAYSGWGPGMYAYGIFRNSIQWAFEAAALPIFKLSPWPYPYNAAYMMRHDFEDYQDHISSIESSAEADNAVGAKGDYYFCTGTLRVEMNNSPSVIASLRRAVSLYGATIGSHNGGLPNPNYPGEPISTYSYWHWGPDEVLNDTIPGYANGAAYATSSIAASLADVDSWMSGLDVNTRTWVSPWFTATREQSLQIVQQLGIQTSGEQKISPFPHWTLSTQTPQTRHNFVNIPASDWFVGSDVAQSMEGHAGASTIDPLVDYYYSIGALINLYSHSLSTDPLPSIYLHYTAAKPAIWPTNASSIYTWWTNRSLVQIVPAYTIQGNRFVITAAVSGAVDPQTAVELAIPNWAMASAGIQVKVNGAFADPSTYRIYNQGLKILVGTSVSTVEVSYPLTAGPTAADDTYSVLSSSALAISAPGVLSNDSNPAGGGLTAVLATEPMHGVLSFNADGSFTYTPSAGFVGTDVFGYYATDGTSQSRVAAVNINVLSAFPPPTAANDDYRTAQNATLNIPAPGVLTNDSSNGNGSLTATLMSSPIYGTVSLNGDGSFTYVPNAGFSGVDTFTYKAFGAGLGSNTATVSITVTAPGATVLFSDDFSGAPGPDPLWLTVTGTWNVANGIMQGSSPAGNYGNAYVNGTWTNYSLQGQVQFPTGAFAGGLGGYVNSSTGAHYAAWIYPESTPGGLATLRLIKFQNWNTWSTLSQASIPAVGSSPHTVVMTFQGNAIQVSVDATQYVSFTDTTSPLLSGGISLDMWTSGMPYTLTFDNILVQSVSTSPVAQNDSYQTTQDSTLTVTAPGVLSNDSSNGNGIMTAAAVAPPVHGSLSLNTDGSYTYTPTSGFSGVDTFTYQASAGGLLSNTATVTINVTASGNSLLFSDDFSGQPGPDPLWVTVSGTWNVSNGVMQGSSAGGNYGYAYASGSWTDYTLQGQVQFLSGGYGGGLGGRLNSSTGAHYATWIYPETSSGGPATLRLIKFQDWTTWSTLSQVSLPAVGTIPHTLVVTLQNNGIQVSVDGVQYLNVTDASNPFLSGGVSMDMWTSTPYTLTFDNILVQALSSAPVAQNDNYQTTQGTALTVSAPGVLGNDTGGSGATAILATSPANGTLVLQADGSFTYTPSAGFTGSDSFTYQASFGGKSSNIATVTVTVTPIAVASVVLNPVNVAGGTSSVGTLTLNAPAPNGGALVTLNSSNPQLAAVPANVTVAANGTAATFAVTTSPVASNTPVTVSASYNSTAKSATLTVLSPVLSGVSLNPSSIQGGSAASGTVTLNAPAPTGDAAVTLLSSDTSTATVPASVVVAANANTATFTVNTNPVASNTSLTISAIYNGTTQTAALTVTPAGLSAVTLSPASVNGGTPSTGTLTLNGPAPAGGAVVTLSSNNTAAATVSPNVTIAANATTATFTVTTIPVSANTSATISAIYGGATQTGTLTVTAATLTSVSLNPTSVRGGSNSTGTVTLNGPAPAGGAVVTLSSSNTAAATLPASVTVAVNSRTATFTVTTIPVAANTSATMSAIYAGTTQTASLTVAPATLNTVSLNPTSVRGGTSSTGTVALNGPAPAGGAVVTLLSSNPAAATVPTSVTIAANATTASFTVTTIPVAANSSATISAIYAGTTRTATLTVTAATLNSVSLSPTSVPGGTTSTGTVTLSGPAPSGGAVVTLTSSRTSAATVPASVTIAANATTATFAVTSIPVASNTSATISAIYAGTTRTASLTVTSATLTSVSLNPTSVKGGGTSTGTVTLNGPAPSGGTVVTLTSSNTGVATVPSSTTVSAGSTTASFTVSTRTVTLTRTVTISATKGVTRNATLTVTP